MMELAETGKPVDFVTLTEQLGQHKEIEAVGGVAYVTSLTDGLPRVKNIEQYVKIVKDKALLRGLIDGIGDLRSVMRARFGDNVRLVPVSAQRRRRWFLPRPRPFAGREPWEPLADFLYWLEARSLWARFGL